VSVLTKLFVVLLIICSLLLTAATVVFVNRTEDFHRAAVLAEERANRFQRDKDAAQRDADAAHLREAEVTKIANDSVLEKQTKISQLSQEVATKDAEINDLKTKNLLAQGTIAEQAAGLKNMGQNVGDVSTRNKALTDEADKLRVRNAELFEATTDFQKRLEEAERERRFLNEQLNQNKSELAKATAVLREKGWPMDLPRKAVALPDLKGYIQDVKTDQGRTFATISLGSKEKVEKGMEFSVVDQTEGTFLGKFIVDSVNEDTSFGRLEGPRVQNVRRENLVLSRL
jgi:hypothetical protein